MGCLWRLIKLGITIFLLALFMRSFGMKWALAFYLQQSLGAEVKIEDVRTDFINHQIKITNLVIQNPLVFKEGTLMVISEVFMDWEPQMLFRGELLLTKLILEIEEVNVLREEGDGLNLYGTKIFRPENRPNSKTSSHFKIKSLILTVKEATFLKTASQMPSPKHYNLGITRVVYTDIQGLSGLAKIIFGESLKAMGLGELSR